MKGKKGSRIRNIIWCILLFGVLAGCKDEEVITADIDEKNRVVSEERTEGDWCYVVVNDTAIEIKKYEGRESNVSVPEMIEGKPVTSIGAEAFMFCTELTKAELPKGLKKIGMSAFFGCSGLKRITIPKSVEKIEHYAFHGCTELKKIKISKKVKEICSAAFSDTAWLKNKKKPVRMGDHYIFAGDKEKVIVPNGVKSVDFYQAGVKEVTLPEGMTELKGNEFAFCWSLEAVKLPESIEKIDASAFYDCNRLETVYVKEGSYAQRYIEEIYPTEKAWFFSEEEQPKFSCKVY